MTKFLPPPDLLLFFAGIALALAGAAADWGWMVWVGASVAGGGLGWMGWVHLTRGDDR